ncbi:three-Cys-motif partner protein TcmP [Mucilaginibacter sp. McL0603]|uniref:three-Cys-motif partner protein TcmP n=1 Tax=Mucilaginibacter sp. McL0603 TaxID=3415670 RepID=UPI003CF739B2
MGSKISNFLEEHSKAKIELWSYYLSIYLNIIQRAPGINKIYIYDVFCGEGKYKGGESGSPLVTLEKIRDHYYANNNTCLNIEIKFNDNGLSEIEKGKKRIDRVEHFAKSIFKPDSVEINYSDFDSNTILTNTINKLADLKNDERALFFIDPWGYKEIDPKQLKIILQNGKTEIILFLPVYLMYMFTNKAISEDNFPGGKPLQLFIRELFGSKTPDLTSELKYINSLTKQFKNYLTIKFSTSFSIERNPGHYFSLFFFTNNKKGFQKMLETKWKLDEQNGRGYKMSVNKQQASLFDTTHVSNYDELVYDFIKKNKSVTNVQLLDFGLENEYLPKHTKVVLDNLLSSDKIKLTSADNKPALSWYIDNDQRKILVSLKQ